MIIINTKINTILSVLFILLFMYGCSNSQNVTEANNIQISSTSEQIVKPESQCSSLSQPQASDTSKLVPNVNASFYFKAKQPVYEGKSIRIYLLFTNNLQEPVNISIAFKVEKLLQSDTNEKYEVVIDTAKFDASDVQFMVANGETRQIGAYIGKLLVYNEKYNRNMIPSGDYKLTAYVNGTQEVTANFMIQDESLPYDNTLYEIKTEFDSYNVNQTNINLTIMNKTKQEVGYGENFGLEILKNDIWKPYPKDFSVKIPQLGYICSAGSSNIEKIDFSQFYIQPFEPGSYRIFKQIGENEYYAEFILTN